MQGGTLITPRLAEEAIHSRLTCLPIESLPLAQCVGGTLREDIYAERDQPPFDRVTMDGIAIDSRSLSGGARRFRITATQAAGAPPLRLERGEAIEVMTGASLPHGSDCVIALEDYESSGGFVELRSSVTSAPAYHNVHRKGSDTVQGTLLLTSGTVLRAPEIAVAASAGLARVRVSSQPAVMIVSTGDELVEPGQPILDHQVRRSNAYAILAALRRRGLSRVSEDHVADAEVQLKDRLSLHLDTHQVLILSGGVSTGRYDLVPRALGSLGVQQVFHHIAQRPGRPMWFGTGPRKQMVFGLPGNPVSTLMCLIRYVIPAVTAAMGTRCPRPAQVALGEPVTVPSPAALFLPVALSTDADGRPWARARRTQGPGDFLALEGTDGFVELPPGPNTYEQGFVAPLHCW